MRTARANSGCCSASSGRESASTYSARGRPLEQVLDECQQRLVGPLEILEDEHQRALVGEPLEEEAPGGEQVLPVGVDPLLQAEQVRQPRADPGSLVGVGNVLGQAGGELLARGILLLALEDLGAHAHHLRQRPVGDALAVGEAAAAVPPDVAREPVEVLEELPRQPATCRSRRRP